MIRGDILYQNTIENLERLGINLTDAVANKGGEEGEEEEISGGTLAAADVLTRFKVSEYDCIETDVLDSAYSGKQFINLLYKIEEEENSGGTLAAAVVLTGFKLLEYDCIETDFWIVFIVVCSLLILVTLPRYDFSALYVFVLCG